MKTSIDMMHDGIHIQHDFGPDLRIDASQLDDEMDKVASIMGWAGELWGDIRKQMTLADSEYRAWRGDMTNQVLTGDPKASEWKIKAMIEANPQFMRHKQIIAELERTDCVLRNTIDALKEKAATMRTRGANLRAEYAATGMNTRATQSAIDQRTTEQRAAAIRNAQAATRQKVVSGPARSAKPREE